MKIIHTADWHLGKIVQGVYMTEDQQYILDQFVKAVEKEQPDVVIIAGDLYDRAVPPTEAVHLLDDVLKRIVQSLHIPVLAIAGNHDSPARLDFGSSMMKANGLHMVGRFDKNQQPVILHDDYGAVHFHLVPYADPSVIRQELRDDTIRSHHDAAHAIVRHLLANRDEQARHVYIGHLFATPYGEAEENSSDSERPLSIGGAEYVDARIFSPFHYSALGHLHQAHYVGEEKIRYAGSILKYSISEERHQKGYLVVELDDQGNTEIEKRLLEPRRDMRTIEGTIDEILAHPICDDYVFVTLLDETPVLSPMEKIRTVYPNAMHVARKNYKLEIAATSIPDKKTQLSELELFQAFYKEIIGQPASAETETLFKDVLTDLLREEK
ncbi:exonuclease SbcCD subunit D [Ornithinibacillus gellani]|uniref:exonuclease SbcCD subunit D n=1 Tax=Ornithinibacillus gellani TaxID=2293253 RepID=UPI000F499A56|nr:exonuclease SbcCD subunit D [Ornithinibacillus gellani]TQS75364.1 exonuclease SbcCD subunit D [Ornithinibacillus gellani]